MDLGLGLEITLIGMAVVFATLLVLMGIVQLPQLAEAVMSKRKIDSAGTHTATEPQIDAVPSEHAAVIAATVAMLGQSYRIRTIEITRNENWEQSRYTEINSL